MITLDANGWELESAIARQRSNPQTFTIPTEAERASLQCGNLVKLLFLLSGRDQSGPYIQCERMWVTVIKADAGEYQGRLESQPRTSQVLQAGDLIHFKPDHVAAIFVSGSQQTEQ